MRRLAELPAKTPGSAALSKDLVTRRFRFVGPTICCAHMQATGMVNDHLVGCFRHAQVGGVQEAWGPATTTGMPSRAALRPRRQLA